jgi:hypothetical protein
LISALAIELAFEGALELHHQEFSAGSAWAFVAVGFAIGAVIYYGASLLIERSGGGQRSDSEKSRVPCQNNLLAVVLHSRGWTLCGSRWKNPDRKFGVAGPHAMIPEAIHEGGSRIVLPTVAGFLFALYLALASALA